MFHLSKGILVLSIPVALSVLVVCNHSVLLLILLILVHFILLKAIPALRGHENIWMFLIVAVSSVPINIYMLTVLNDHYFLLNSFLLLDIIKGILYYVILLSVEEIIMGVITRLIWRKQYKIKFLTEYTDY